MIKRTTAIVFGLAVLSALGQAQIKWERDLDAAMKKAKANKTLIFIDFYADWCGPCKQMDKTTFQDKSAIKSLSSFVTLKQNIDKEGKKAAMKYKVELLPTLMVLDANGKIVLMTEGGVDPTDLAAFLKEAKKKASRAKK
jgi:thiol:disulfide interchange protein